MNKSNTWGVAPLQVTQAALYEANGSPQHIVCAVAQLPGAGHRDILWPTSLAVSGTGFHFTSCPNMPFVKD